MGYSNHDRHVTEDWTPPTEHSEYSWDEIVLPPGESMRSRNYLTDKDIEDLTSRTKKAELHVYGIIRYRDVFGDSHESQFWYVCDGCYVFPDRELSFKRGTWKDDVTKWHKYD